MNERTNNSIIKKTLLAISAVSLAFALSACDFSTFYSSDKTYETEAPELPANLDGSAVLLFTKTNGYRHESIEAGVERIKKIAKRKGWVVFHTENAAVFNKSDLQKFSSTVWLSTSGDILTKEQQVDFTQWLESGKGFVGIHGAGGDPKFDGQWTWFVDNIIGALFTAHIMFPQFQEAKVLVEDKSHPASKNLPSSWMHVEEWYTFDRNPRDGGFKILATVDESTYSTKFGLKDIAMGEDHPIAWHNCLAQGRTFYTALGHQDESYDTPEFISMIEGAMSWAARLEGTECDPEVAASTTEEQSTPVEAIPVAE